MWSICPVQYRSPCNIRTAESFHIIASSALYFCNCNSIYSKLNTTCPIIGFTMARDRKKECWDQYTKDTEEVAKFLKGQGVRFHCRTELLETPKPDRSHRSHDICLYNFTPIAEHLAKQGTFSVPADIIDTVDRVIELRTECNRIHMETRTEKTAADERHLHAIQIFREIRKHLGPKKEARPATLGAEAETMPGKP